MSTFRVDRSPLPSKVVRLDNGFVRLAARLTRVGVFDYANTTTGERWKELRPAEEVFHPDSLASFALLPMVDDHPSENGGAVDAHNAQRLQVGTVGPPTKDGDFVAAEVLLTAASAIAKVDAGKQELSCGYYCDREVAPAGSPYKFIQRNIRGNHVAIVERGRAGPEARLKLDTADGVQVDCTPEQDAATLSPPIKKVSNMKKIQIDGVTFEVSEQVAEAFAKVEVAQAKLTADAAAAGSVLDKATARADVAESDLKAAKAEIAKLKDPAMISAAVAERASLETVATANGIKCDGLDNAAIKCAVIAKLDKEIKLDGKSADYVDAMFVALSKRSPTADAIANAVKNGDPKAGEKKADVRKAHRDAFFAPKA